MSSSYRPFHRLGDDPTHIPPQTLTAHGLTQYDPDAAATVAGPQTRPPLDALFRDPPPPPSKISPRRFPGIDPSSTVALLKSLSDNHVRWHIFFNYKGFHNHAAHHLLAIWAMGAPGPVIDAAYATYCEYQRPAFEPPAHINHRNFRKHLGDERYYSGYLDYFTTELLKNGLPECIEQYIFSPDANFSPGNPSPEMLSRFVDGALHPLIHVGYGAEFSSIGIAAEGPCLITLALPSLIPSAVTGLAMTAVQASNEDLLARNWFPDVVSSVSSRGSNRTALSILALVSCDPRFSHIQKMNDETMFPKTIMERGPIIHEYVNMWRFDISTEAGIANAVEELCWVNALIYGVGGYSPERDFKADFFLMHLVASSIFLSSLLACVKKFSSRRLLLLTYLTCSLSFYIARGRPHLDISAFYQATENLLHEVLGATTAPSPNTLPASTSGLAQTPNAWLPLIQSTIVHPDDHLCKAQRALAHCAELYGIRKKGWCVPPEGRMASPAQIAREEEAEEKVGLQDLDGTVFLRVALLTQNRLGWMREGESLGDWNDDGFYWKPEECS